MKIKQITLVNSGFKGIEIVHLNTEERNGKPFIREVKEKKRYPIHLGLENPIKDLRYHLLNVYEFINKFMDKDIIDDLIDRTEVITVEFSDDSFRIKGKIFNYDKFMPLNASKIEEGSGYQYHEVVMKIINKIIEETQLYMNGDVKVEDIELVKRYISAGKEKGFDLDSFNSLEAEEQIKFCTDIMEKRFGASVLLADDVDIIEEQESEIQASDNDSFIIDEGKEPIILNA